jgi:hypothetical protein
MNKNKNKSEQIDKKKKGGEDMHNYIAGFSQIVLKKIKN